MRQTVHDIERSFGINSRILLPEGQEKLSSQGWLRERSGLKSSTSRVFTFGVLLSLFHVGLTSLHGTCSDFTLCSKYSVIIFLRRLVPCRGLPQMPATTDCCFAKGFSTRKSENPWFWTVVFGFCPVCVRRDCIQRLLMGRVTSLFGTLL